MILIDNRNVLRTKDRELLNTMSEWDHREPTGHVIVEQAKTGVPTIKVVHNGKPLYVQSKYDPQKEAERFVGKYADELVNYVLFVGVGTAYHIEAFLALHPDAKFAVYEPNEEVLHTYLSTFRLDKLPTRNLLKIFTGTNQDDVSAEVQKLLTQSNNVLKIITLPVYEKIYGEQVSSILENALEAVKNKHSALATNIAFQKRWTINSIKNFPTVLKTPNILHDIHRSAFEGKPAIIVAAGPSLNEEFENLRYIKEHGLAYIFSVGSAINALIEHGIYPDAACTYDPQHINYKVIQVIKDKQIDEIPLVFGSSVGFETIENYPGDLLHMIVSQDTVSPAFLEWTDSVDLDYVNDAPSIAVITLQLLIKLHVKQIILVGQNLSYINNQYYAKGIDYGEEVNQINIKRMESTLSTKDVYGNDVKTNEGFARMKSQLELYILANPQVKVWNTTKGGAAIQGTEFKILEDLIKETLNETIIDNSWSKIRNSYNLGNLTNKLHEMDNQGDLLESAINKMFSTLQSINKEVKLKKTKQLEELYTQLDKEVKIVQNNLFYKVFIEPMIRVQQERLAQNIAPVRYEKNALKKAETIKHEFTLYAVECMSNYQNVLPLYNEMKKEIDLIK